MATFPQQAGKIKVKGFSVLQGRPCKIVEVHKCKTGKHGSGKVRLVGLDIINSRKIEGIFPSRSTIQVPNITRTECQFLSYQNGFATVIMPDSETAEIPVHGKIRQQMESMVEIDFDFDWCVAVIEVMGEIIASSMKRFSFD
mmetsp:Transcript_87433/g.131149  ORF Transcript_87433/g.131149 Transcript_87433/m.131149 type:complete len:142 (-) Transcript_87433:30-455(-)